MKGFRIWEIQDNGVPKEIHSSEELGDIYKLMDTLLFEEKTYAIRIGKGGLK